MRVGFLFNHEQIHQIAHSLPIALELSSSAEVVLATTCEPIAAEVRRIAAAAGKPEIEPRHLGLSSLSSILLERALGRVLPARRILVYRDNLDFFRGLDALVVTERTSLILKTKYGLHGLKMILADHGAGDRAIGYGPEVRKFDHVLAAGPKIAARLTAESGVDPERLSVTGYPKFDVASSTAIKLPFADNGRPTVLYNPHVSPHLSSWYPMGRAVLDFFLESDRYNLIFAPHVMLFQRPLALSIDKLRAVRPGVLDEKYCDAPNIHVDLGSRACTDMSYTNAADIYLGDVSSQIYEFIRRPRPAAFLNAHRVDYRGDPNYAHWRTGPVIDDARDLAMALQLATLGHETLFAPVQRELFDYTFDVTGEPAGKRAARAILSLVGGGNRVEEPMLA